MKKKTKKILILFIVIIVMSSIIFLVYNNLSKKDNIDRKIDSTLFTMPVTYMIMDSSTPDDVDIEKANDEYQNLMLNFIPSVNIELEENGEYFIGKLYDLKINQDIVDYAFTYNNLMGQVIDDCIFDKDKKIIKIPKKYYKEDQTRSQIQLEIVSKMKAEEIKNTSINVKINNIIRKEKITEMSGYDTSTKISIVKYNKNNNLSKENLKIYINDEKIQLNEILYDYNPTSGVIEIGLSPLVIKDIYVDVSKKGLFNSLISSVNAAGNGATKTYEKMRYAGKLKGEPNVNVGTTYKLENVPVAYKGGDGKIYGDKDNTGKHIDDVRKDSLYQSCDKEGKCTLYNGAYDHFAAHLDVGNFQGERLDFAKNTYVKLYCVDHVESAGASDTMNFDIKVIAKENNYIILKFTSPDNFFGQKPSAILKFVWEDNEGSIIAKKYLYEYKNGEWKRSDNEESANGTFAFTLYDNLDSCEHNNLLDSEGEKETDAFSNVRWDNLDFGTYYVKETKCGNILDGNSTYKYKCDDRCHKVVLNKDDLVPTESDKVGYDKDYEGKYVENSTLRTQFLGNGNTSDATDPIKNYKRYYCFTVQKQSNLPGSDVSGISFESSIETSLVKKTVIESKTTTTSNSSVTFGPYEYGMYYYRESGENSTHWNNNSQWKKANLYEASYGDSNKPFCPTSNAAHVTDTHKKWCTKIVKKDKSTNAVITTPATFRLCADSQCATELARTTTVNGIATFMGLTHDGTPNTGGTSYYVQEISAPAGYSISDKSPKQAPTATLLAQDKTDSTNSNDCTANPENFVFYDSKNLLNWYKVTENGATRANGAEFNVKDNTTGKYITVSGTETQIADDGTSKVCYKYSGESDNASVLTSMNTNTNGSVTDGEVCVSGLENQGSYTITETKSAQYHTLGAKTQIELTSQTNFTTMNDNNKFINSPTEFEFTKTVTSGDGDEKIIVNGVEKTLSELTTEEFKQIEFNVFDADSNLLSFVQNSDGSYEYTGNTIDPPSGTLVTALYLNDDRKIRIKHLSYGATFSIKEKETKVCNSASDYDKCIGYYYPNYSEDSDYKFTITNTYNSISTQNLENKPTEITFTKKDFYGYYDQSDVVDFVDDKERSDFDKITFKLKDSNGKYLTLKFIGNHGSCLTDDSYSEYRYVYSDNSDGEEGTELHTCGGHIKITNLCRGQKYTVEEISVPENSAFVKENTDSTPTEAEYIIPCSEDETTKNSTTNLISDKPTRVRFEKRDSKYGYLIPDETTTFKVYRCKKGETDCHPSDYSTDEERETAGMKLMKFYSRSVITNDEEDPKDAEGLAGVEVYKAMSDSDVSNGTKYETELHPYHGILVFRYLQSGYTYVLVETVAPKNYTLPAGRNAETKFTVRNDTVDVDEVDVANKPTSLLIRKYSDNGKLLSGAQFKIYERKSCDPNLTAKAQVNDGSATLMKLKTIRDGVYESRGVFDTDTIVTCADSENSRCSDISTNEVTKLTYTDYLGSWADFDDESTQTNEGTKIELQEGEALIQYLEYGHCYIVEETKAPKGYSLPENDEDRFTMITIEENNKYAHDTYKSLINKPTPFTFYKYDEFNKLLDGAEFKLQKLGNNKRYYDVTVTREEQDGKVYYKVDNNADNTVITTQSGSATVYYLESGQYRIVETKPAPGKELSKNPNMATFFVDESGNVYGNSIIVNKSKTERIEVKNSASAEFIVNIQTGQTVIKYGLVIAVLIALITGLMIIRKKMNKRGS